MALSMVGPHADDGISHVVDGAQVLLAQRMRNTDLGEHSPAPGLGPECGETRVCAVHRDAETQRDVTLELGGVVGHQV
jgi:hypothetical protein